MLAYDISIKPRASSPTYAMHAIITQAIYSLQNAGDQVLLQQSLYIMHLTARSKPYPLMKNLITLMQGITLGFRGHVIPHINPCPLTHRIIIVRCNWLMFPPKTFLGTHNCRGSCIIERTHMLNFDSVNLTIIRSTLTLLWANLLVLLGHHLTLTHVAFDLDSWEPFLVRNE